MLQTHALHKMFINIHDKDRGVDKSMTNMFLVRKNISSVLVSSHMVIHMQISLFDDRTRNVKEKT